MVGEAGDDAAKVGAAAGVTSWIDSGAHALEKDAGLGAARGAAVFIYRHNVNSLLGNIRFALRPAQDERINGAHGSTLL